MMHYGACSQQERSPWVHSHGLVGARQSWHIYIFGFNDRHRMSNVVTVVVYMNMGARRTPPIVGGIALLAEPFVSTS